MQASAVPQKIPRQEKVLDGAAADVRTAVATEDLAVWTARDVLIDGLTGAFTLAAATFAFFAYKQTKRQASAAEAQTDLAKEELEVSRRAMTMQMRSSALSLRPQLVAKQAVVNLQGAHPAGIVVFEFEPRGSLDPFELQAGATVGFRVPGEDEWTIAPLQPENVTLSAQPHFPANENTKIRFDFEYDEQALINRGDTWFEFRAIMVLRWKDALNWSISETWEANGRILVRKSGSGQIVKDDIHDSPPENI